MKLFLKSIVPIVGVTFGLALMQTAAGAADEKESATKGVMKKYHKAPQGVDPVSKKATMGAASKEEIKELVTGYKAMMKEKPPKGDAASWKDKTAKLASAAEALQKGEADGVTRFKEAVNCKACHSAHKPD